MTDFLPAFRLGDVRGIYPDELDEDFAVAFGHAFVHHFGLKGRIVTGRDMRDSSASLQAALNHGLEKSGMDVLDIGLCTTELGYFASAQPDIVAAIVVTASHNPSQYNGFKCVLRNGEAVTFDSGSSEVMQLMLGNHRNSGTRGSCRSLSLKDDYIEFLQQQFSVENLGVGRIALNGLNGTAATLAGTLAKAFDLNYTWFRKEPGPIPSQGADPVNQILAAQMQEFMRSDDFTLGVAWDGDCDRCVFFGSDGKLIPTYYIIGLLAGHFLKQHPAGAVVFDTKLCWNTFDVIAAHGGRAVPAETGHAFMKRKMREHNAVYGGELSSHHYFGPFFGCDSGMFAWLKVVEIINQTGTSISELVQERRENISCTPEINLSLTDVDTAFDQVLSSYRDTALSVDYFDGLGFEMPGDWRFSLRQSKTEALVRVNLESRNATEAMLNGGAELLQRLKPFKADDADWEARLIVQ